MLPESSVTLDESHWPLQVVRFVGALTAPQLDFYLAETVARLRRREKYLSIVDLTRGSLSTPEQRQRQVAWMHEHEDLVREGLLGVAFVITSPLVRLAVMTVTYLRPMPVPYLFTAQELEAAAWASARFEEQGLHPMAGRVRSQYGLPARGYASGNNASCA
ncbi:MAG: hypothetical protein ACXU86_20405 [Archangium sp.]